MKRFILLLSICWIGFVGCSSNSAEKEPEPVIPTIDLGTNTGGITLPEEQGVTAQLTFTTNVEWSITTSDTRAVPTWFDVTPKSGQAGTHTVTVSVVEPNELYDDRSGFIEINYGTEQHRVMVTQKRKEAILLTQAKYEVPMAGGTVSVEVKSNLDYTTTIKQPEWIHQTGTRGLTAATLNFTVDASEESVQREGQIVFQAGDLNETVHIYQAGGDILVLTQKEYTVSAAGETITVELKSNADYTRSISPPLIGSRRARHAPFRLIRAILRLQPTRGMRIARRNWYSRPKTSAKPSRSRSCNKMRLSRQKMPTRLLPRAVCSTLRWRPM